VAPPREIDPQGTYHVMSRGNFRQRIFLDEGHYAKYMRLLTRVARRRRWVVLDWCLIENHFHLVIELTEGGLSDGMRELNGCFARWSNLQTGRTGTGHLFKNRFRCRPLLTDGHFWEVLRYVPLNPVRAKLVPLPEDWPWSGYRATIGREHPRPFHQPGQLLRLFAVSPPTALRRYRAFVSEGLGRPDQAPWSDEVG
jgi:REP element-mobilizing transposase RayT